MESPQQTLQRAIESFQASRFAEAIALFDRALLELPDLHVIEFVKAMAYQQIGKPDEAVIAVSAALSRIPEHREARQLYHNLTGRHWTIPFSPLDTEEAHSAMRFLDQAMTFLQDGFPLQAFVCAEKAASFKLTIPNAHFVKGMCLKELGRCVEALESFERELLLQPENAQLQIEIKEAESARFTTISEKGGMKKPLFVRKPTHIIPAPAQQTEPSQHDGAAPLAEIASESSPQQKPAERPRKVLFFSPYGSHRVHNQFDAVVAAALEVRGCQVAVARCDGLFHDCHVTTWSKDKVSDCASCAVNGNALFATFGLEVIQLRQHVTSDEIEMARHWVERIPPEDYASARYEDLPIGEWALPAVFSRFRIKSTYIDRADACAVFKNYLVHSVTTILAVRRLYDSFQPDAVCMWSGWANPYRIAFELARKRSLPVVTHERGAQMEIPGGSFRVVSNDFPGRNSSCNQIAEMWKDIPLSTSELNDVKGIFIRQERTGGGGMYDFQTDVADVRAKLNIPREARVVGVFTSGDYETSTHPDFKDAPDQIEVLEQLLIELDTLDCYVVIRHHPNMASAENKVGENEFITRAYDLARKSGSRVRVVMPHEELTSYALLWICDIAMSFYSSMSLEATMRGIPSTVFEMSAYAEAFRHAIPTSYKGGALRLVVKGLFEQHNNLNCDDLRRLYRRTRSIFFKTEKVFKSFAIKNQYEMDMRVSGPADLQVGRDPELDRVCDFLIHGSSIITMPSKEEAGRTQQEEDSFFENELIAAAENRSAMAELSRNGSITELPRVAVIACISSRAANSYDRSSLRRSRHTNFSRYDFDVTATSWLSNLQTIVDSVAEEFVLVSVDWVEYDECFLGAALKILTGPQEVGSPLNSVNSGAWILSKGSIRSEMLTRYKPTRSIDEVRSSLSSEEIDLTLLSLTLFRTETLKAILKVVAEKGSYTERSGEIFNYLQSSDCRRMLRPLALVHTDEVLVPSPLVAGDITTQKNAYRLVRYSN